MIGRRNVAFQKNIGLPRKGIVVHGPAEHESAIGELLGGLDKQRDKASVTILSGRSQIRQIGGISLSRSYRIVR